VTQIILALGIFSGSVWQIISSSSTFGLIILITLVVMSLVSWSIIFGKYRLFRKVSYQNEAFLQQFRRSRMIADIAGQARQHPLSPLSAAYLAGLEEIEHLREKKNQAAGLRDKTVPLIGDDFEIVEMAMERSSTEEFAGLERQVIFLATTGSSAPFMGLLGTVVGIMDSFWSIGQQGSASLAIVAPGIAEALLATIVGLGAAIPAVIAYNWANNTIKRMNDRTYAFTLAFIARARKEEL